MGQGQADVALQALRECVRSGEWLCLKNLHLVTPWLPLLEKVSTSCLCVKVNEEQNSRACRCELIR